jgi:hypothetical protein
MMLRGGKGSQAGLCEDRLSAIQILDHCFFLYAWGAICSPSRKYLGRIPLFLCPCLITAGGYLKESPRPTASWFELLVARGLDPSNPVLTVVLGVLGAPNAPVQMAMAGYFAIPAFDQCLKISKFLAGICF